MQHEWIELAENSITLSVPEAYLYLNSVKRVPLHLPIEPWTRSLLLSLNGLNFKS
jgi:hypothetical protein